MRDLKVLFLLSAMLLGIMSAFAKKALDHDAFDNWKKITNFGLSRNGEWEIYSLQPGEGDDLLTLYNTKSKKRIDIERGYKPKFTADSRWAVVQIKPLFADTRKAKIDKKKELDMPQDSLAIIDLKTGKVEKIANVVSFSLGKDGGQWLAYQSVDTIYAKIGQLKDKEAGKPLIVRNLDSKESKVVKWVKDYAFSKDGMKLAMSIKKPEKDSVTTNGIGVMLLPDTAFFLIDRDKKFYGKPVFDEKGNQLAYVAGNDSTDSGTKKLEVYLADPSNLMRGAKEISVSRTENKGRHLQRPNMSDPQLQGAKLQEWAERQQRSRGDSLFVNQYSNIEFSHNGKRLVVGIAPNIAPNDTTIVDFERADLDIWRWDAPMTPPQETINLNTLRKKQFPVVIDLANGHQELMTTLPYCEVSAPDRWDGNWALLADATENMVEKQWNYLAPVSLSIKNVNNGETREVAVAAQDNYMLSPSDKFVVWYDKRQYYAYNIDTGETVCISKEIEFPLWDEDDDHPMDGEPYGITAWTEDDEYVLVNDKYDIWALDPTGARKPFCLTNGEGRKTGRQYRYFKTDSEQRMVKPGDLMLFRVFDYKDKTNGLASMTYNRKSQTPNLRLMEGATFSQIRKAKNADVFSWERANFEISPDVWVATSLDFGKAVQVSDANPQMKDYSWGTAQLFKWYAYDGKPAEGVLYLPENFNPNEEYPMLCVFYETGSENLYRHYAMEPSWSWVNYPFYVSRGYVVFVPDIHYNSGLPGESAYNYVCSGTEAVCDMYPNIDRKRIGIDGQSWGGYQTAYLVTRTDMFACAGSGAPVSNMTSAFGGIRWESGDSRQAQYEMGQSRIGRNLWDAPELYIANSPLFHADRCHTPLLIMHNDADGAVPWYQGIELFMALRRLNKPVWMLQYNGEAHNIKERRNRKDITVRLQQFFDHYLKGDPMPRWMREGISPLRKGQDMGY